MGPLATKLMKAKFDHRNVATIRELLDSAREFEVHVFACQMTMAPHRCSLAPLAPPGWLASPPFARSPGVFALVPDLGGSGLLWGPPTG
jgi:hypothetical protein